MGPPIESSEGAREIDEHDFDSAGIYGFLVLLVRLCTELSFPTIDIVFDSASGRDYCETSVRFVTLGLRNGILGKTVNHLEILGGLRIHDFGTVK